MITFVPVNNKKLTTMFCKDLLKDQVILITGGGSGLGLAMAKKFAELSANIAICGRTEEKLINATKEISEKNPEVKVKYYVADVRDYEKAGEVIKSIVNDFGKMTGLVNNAAGNFLSATEDLSYNGFKSIVDIVLFGTFNFSHHFGKYLIENKLKGNILNIVTTYADMGSGYVLPSAAAKAGVKALTGSLAYEWGPYGIRVNAIAPGPFPTKGAWSRLVPDEKIAKMITNRIPLKRTGNPEELANLAAFLMSDLSNYLTGEIVTIDGGERLAGAEFSIIDQIFPDKQTLRNMLTQLKNLTRRKK